MTSISDSIQPRYSVFSGDCPADPARAIIVRLLMMAASSTVVLAVLALVFAHFARA